MSLGHGSEQQFPCKTVCYCPQIFVIIGSKYPPEEHLLQALLLRADLAAPVGLLLDKVNLEEMTAVTSQNIELLRHY